MEFGAWLLLGSFIFLMIIRVPIAFSLGLSSLITCLYAGIPLSPLAQRMVASLESFPLMTIPFFILAGHIMSEGGIARRIVDFASILVGRMRGGLAMVNIVGSMFFGGTTGSSVADVASVGPVMIPMMERKGYGTDFAVSVTVSASTTGIILPPSHNAIIYAVAAGGAVSIGSMFLAGYIPGILIGLGLMLVSYVLAVRRGYAKEPPKSLAEIWNGLRNGFLSLMAAIIIVGGIVSGVFTATESGAIACVYALLLTMFYYRELKWRQLPEIMRKVAITCGMVFFLVATSSAFGWIMAYQHIPQTVAAGIKAISTNPAVVLLIINIFILIIGFFMDMAASILILTPIFLPIATSIGMDPIQFGIMLLLNLSIGLIHPPVGTALFVGCAVAKCTLESTVKAILMFIPVLILILLLVTYVPAVTMTLPKMFMP
ncbi:trap transporter permease protein [Lucifera butyrica]|uniref:Trap transporter permease protein n=1 Tax=Lucifera butyrica TaxID=1351585 RepID=A0A498R3G0_9FIRM|nr:TRAP transporter large permease [Lucifera butyrica]VBB05387.1 trap transporter permease protein [Lucifera butyrica]